MSSQLVETNSIHMIPSLVYLSISIWSFMGKNIKNYQEQIDAVVDIEKVAEVLFMEKDPRKWLCPFHDDHHPGSFKVFRANQRFKCFSCGAYGGSIRLTMHVKHCTYLEAIFWLENTFQGQTSIKLPVKKEEQEECPIDIRDKVYRTFMKGMRLGDTNALSLQDRHREYLHKRGLSEQEIARYGYFTMPDRTILPFLVKEMSRQGISRKDIIHVPGFYMHKESHLLDMAVPEGIGIPIRDAKGMIQAIQVRRDEIHANESRYVWFSSGWIHENPTARKLFEGGSSPGSPIDFFQGDPLTLALTEGHFKAVTLARYFTGTIWSLQGVGMQREMRNILVETRGLKTIYIVFDADYILNEQVYKQIKSAGEKCKGHCKSCEVICWDLAQGKGIDDALHNHAAVYAVPFALFCQICDAYWQKAQAESNVGKLHLYASMVIKPLHQKKYKVLG